MSGKSVLDVGCGCGYGSDFLARNGARDVTSVDVSREAITRAMELYSATTNAKFLIADAQSHSLGVSVFDIVTSFEMLEHVADYVKCLEGIRRAMKEDGLLILSTPNRCYWDSKIGRGNAPSQFHTKEFYPDELQDALRVHFRHVDIWFQAISVKRKELLAQSKLSRTPSFLKRVVPMTIQETMSSRFRGYSVYPHWNDIELMRPNVDSLESVIVAICSNSILPGYSKSAIESRNYLSTSAPSAIGN